MQTNTHAQANKRAFLICVREPRVVVVVVLEVLPTSARTCVWHIIHTQAINQIQTHIIHYITRPCADGSKHTNLPVALSVCVFVRYFHLRRLLVSSCGLQTKTSTQLQQPSAKPQASVILGRLIRVNKVNLFHKKMQFDGGVSGCFGCFGANTTRSSTKHHTNSTLTPSSRHIHTNHL